MGGDGFYACWKNPYMEPSLKGKVMAGQVLILDCVQLRDYQERLALSQTTGMLIRRKNKPCY